MSVRIRVSILPLEPGCFLAFIGTNCNSNPPVRVIERACSCGLISLMMFQAFIELCDVSCGELMYEVVEFPGLSYDTNETVLRDAFQPFGDIIEGKLGSGCLLSSLFILLINARSLLHFLSQGHLRSCKRKIKRLRVRTF